MKTKMFKLFLMNLTLVLIFNSSVALSAGNSNPNVLESNYWMDSNYFAEYFSYEKMNQALDKQLMPEISVKIFNFQNQLIATGSESDEKVKSLVKIADLLVEIDGTRFYRLSY